MNTHSQRDNLFAPEYLLRGINNAKAYCPYQEPEAKKAWNDAFEVMRLYIQNLAIFNADIPVINTNKQNKKGG